MNARRQSVADEECGSPAGQSVAAISASASSGIGVAANSRSSAISAEDRAPTSTVVTAGWRSANCSAAAPSATPRSVHASRQAPGALEHVRGCGRVVVGAVRVGIDEHARVEHAPEDHADATRLAPLQQSGSAAVEQRVAAGEQHAVEIDALDEPPEHLVLVHARADRPNDALVAQLQERRKRVRERVALVQVGVVHERDVDVVGAEADQALLERSQHRVARVVEVRIDLADVAEDRLGAVGAGRIEHPSDLGREHVLVARSPTQRVPEAPFRGTVPVQRRGVEVPDAARPRGVDRRVRVLVADAREHVADRRGAEAEAGHRRTARAELAEHAPVAGGHVVHAAPCGYASVS